LRSCSLQVARLQDLTPYVAAIALAGTAAGCGGVAGIGGGGSTFHSSVSATLGPAAEVESAGAAGGSGTVELTLDRKTGNVCWTLTYKGLPDKPISAHVQQASAGETGPDVIPLGATFAAKGCVLAPAESASAIGRHPGDYYVNVYTARYLHGAIRGQLGPSAAGSTTA
jgi:hypothetical protein